MLLNKENKSLQVLSMRLKTIQVISELSLNSETTLTLSIKRV